MSEPETSAILRFMPASPATTRVTLEMEIVTDAIRGHLDDGCGQSRAFDGWLELSSLLDLARRAQPSPSERTVTP